MWDFWNDCKVIGDCVVLYGAKNDDNDISTGNSSMMIFGASLANVYKWHLLWKQLITVKINFSAILWMD